jgi:hypothetical protein
MVLVKHVSIATLGFHLFVCATACVTVSPTRARLIPYVGYSSVTRPGNLDGAFTDTRSGRFRPQDGQLVRANARQRPATQGVATAT